MKKTEKQHVENKDFFSHRITEYNPESYNVEDLFDGLIL